MPQLIDHTLKFLRAHGLAREADIMEEKYLAQDSADEFDARILGIGSFGEIRRDCSPLEDLDFAALEEAQGERQDAAEAL